MTAALLLVIRLRDGRLAGEPALVGAAPMTAVAQAPEVEPVLVGVAR